ncbi:MAG: FAD-dependent oxidoreductase [Pseudomonadota bacterium]
MTEFNRLPQTETVDVCVVGAGVSGSSFAYRCAEDGASVAVLEEADTPGGCIKTHRYENGDAAELGARAYYNSYGTMLDLLGSLDAKGAIVPLEKTSFRFYADKAVRSILSQLSIVQLAMSLPKLAWVSSSGLSVADYYSKILGRRNYTGAFRYAARAVLSQPADAFPAELLFRKRERDKTQPKSFTLEGGNVSLVEKLLDHERINLKLKCGVTNIERRGDRFHITQSDGAVIDAAAVALSPPAPIAGQLLADAAPDLASLLQTLATSTVETLHVAVEPGLVDESRRANLIGMDQSFYSALFKAGRDRDLYTFHFAQDAGLDREAKHRVAAEALDLPVDALTIVSERRSVLPALKASDLPSLDAIRAELEAQSSAKGIFLPCNYMQGLSIEDCCQQSLQEHRRWARSQEALTPGEDVITRAA